MTTIQQNYALCSFGSVPSMGQRFARRIFADGFESGGMQGWSGVLGEIAR